MKAGLVGSPTARLASLATYLLPPLCFCTFAHIISTLCYATINNRRTIFTVLHRNLAETTRS